MAVFFLWWDAQSARQIFNRNSLFPPLLLLLLLLPQLELNYECLPYISNSSIPLHTQCRRQRIINIFKEEEEVEVKIFPPCLLCLEITVALTAM